jgi:alpha-D-xyloside xylohydrolase
MAMLNAWADGTKPWTFPEVADAVRDVMQLRIRLLPYLYSAFAQYHFRGTPPFRAMALVDGFRADIPDSTAALSSTENPYAIATRRDIKDQFMVGDNLLVAPMFAGDTSRTVILPKGRWYDFYTGALAGDGAVITIKPGLEGIPLFVRDGGIIPMLAESRRQIPGVADAPDLEVRHYGDAAGTFDLYDDDGLTFDYERGAFSWTQLRVRRSPDGALRVEMTPASKDKPFGYGTIRWNMMK